MVIRIGADFWFVFVGWMFGCSVFVSSLVFRLVSPVVQQKFSPQFGAKFLMASMVFCLYQSDGL